MPTGKYTRPPLLERFWKNVRITPGCWEWIPAIGKKYGSFNVGPGKSAQTHRFSYDLHKGPIPRGLLVCHSCDVKWCVNPDHLWLGTNTDNIRDAARKGLLATGDRHPWRINPERAVRGDRHPWRLHPELVRRGEANHQARLTDDLVRYIRSRIAEGIMQKHIAAELGVSKMTVSRAARGESWRHVS